MNHCQHTPTQLSKKIRPWCSLQMINLRRHKKSRRLRLCQQFHNSSDITIFQHPHIRYSQTFTRRPQNLCRGNKRNDRKSHCSENKVAPTRFHLGPTREMAPSKEKFSPLSVNSIRRPTKKRLPPLQASRIPGAWIPPSISYHEQTRHPLQTTTSCADRVISGHIRKSYARFYFQTTVKKSNE